jgi:hypothetical protein
MPRRHRIIPQLTPQDIERFGSHIDTTPGQGPQGECWTWKKGLNIGGYGRFSIHGESFTASRVMFAIVHGRDPGPLAVCHTCDFPACLNWHHLFEGTDKENTQDAIRKGRIARGDQHYLHLHPEFCKRGDDHVRTKIIEVQRRVICAAYATGNITTPELAEMFDITFSGICRILRRNTNPALTERIDELLRTGTKRQRKGLARKMPRYARLPEIIQDCQSGLLLQHEVADKYGYNRSSLRRLLARFGIQGRFKQSRS